MKKFLFALSVWAVLPLHGWAWGVEGHRAVGNIAEHHLTDKARVQIAALLGTQSLTLVSTQPDEMLSLPEYKSTSPWHYINTPLGLGHDQYIQAIKAQPGANAYNILLQKIKEMRDPAKTREQRAEALIFVVHLVGDVHQPFHTGRAEDRGGNDIKVTYRGKDTNMHGLIEYQGLDYTEMGQQYSTVPSATIKTWQAADPAEWFFESYTAATKLYGEVTTGQALDFRYFPAHAPLLKLRLEQAGIRLAGVLNEAFK
jgi:hypothetical protein